LCNRWKLGAGPVILIAGSRLSSVKAERRLSIASGAGTPCRHLRLSRSTMYALAFLALLFADDVSKLIDRLGAGGFARRLATMQKLEDVGEPALELLQKASKEHRDPEVRARAKEVIKLITDKLYGELKAMGSPGGGYWLNRVAFTPDGKQAVVSGGAVIF